ncbi:LysR substrate-binding domain-containing protein [Maribrevibacterium harenarium]|uniref:LysR substrate-binding domain-containing protein n=1 Tax=Maribrevibacterium harenarium TaxID=2589817 RepID=UPI001C61434F|nr:LysR substrate-binding domain-containing protein [Maribrevibacterium harenarium]
MFYQAVKDLPTAAQHALRMSQRAAKGLSGSLHLGFTGTAALNPKIPDSIKAFQAVYPEVELVIKEAITLQKLAASSFIMTAREDAISLHDTVLEKCRIAGFDPSISPAAPQVASILSLVAANLGVSLLPDAMR